MTLRFLNLALVAMVFALCLAAGPARAEIKQVNYWKGNTSSATTSVSVTPTSSTTAGDLLVAMIFVDGAPTSITSPAGWQSVTPGGYQSAVTAFMVYYENAPSQAANAPISFSWTGNLDAVVILAEYKGVMTSGSLDTSNATGSNTSTSQTTGSATATAAAVDGMAIGGVAKLSNVTYTTTTNSFNIYSASQATAGTAISGILVDAQVTAAAAQTTTVSISGGTGYKGAGVIANFKASPDKYFIGTGTNTDCNNGANWSSYSGSAAYLNEAPGSTANVYFDGGPSANLNGNCTFSANTNLKSLTISGYTGTIGGSTYRIDLTGDYVQSSGTFNASSGGILYVGGGTFNKTGGTFNHPGDVVLFGTIQSGTLSKTFTPGSSNTTFTNLIINDGLVGFWRLDETAAGATVIDYSGNGNHGTPHGTTNPTPDTSNKASAIKFSNAAALPLDGSTQYVSFPLAHMMDGASPTTLSMWAYASSAYAGQNLSEFNFSSGTTIGWFLGWKSTGPGDRLSAYTPGASFICPLSGNGNAAAGWHHLAYTYANGPVENVYMDGVPTATCTTAGFPGTVTAMELGRRASGYYTAGTFDEVRLYNRALSAAEIYDLYRGYEHVTSTTTYTLAGNLTVNGDLSMMGGTLDLNGNTLTLGGNYYNHGGHIADTSGTVALSGSGGSIYMGRDNFYNLSITGNQTWTLLDRLNVKGALAMTTGTLSQSASNYPIHVGSINKTGGTLSGSGSLTIGGTSNANIDLSSTSISNVYVEVPQETNLVGYWKMDVGVGNTVYDMTSNGNSGTLSALATFSSTVPSSSQIAFENPHSADLTAASTYIDLGTSSTLNPSAQLSISAWVYPTTTGTLRTIINRGSSNAYEIDVDASNHLVTKAYINGSLRTLTGTVAMSANTWYHVALTYDGSTFTGYLNGSSIATPLSVSGALGTNTSNTYVGMLASSQYLVGLVDDLRIYSTGLSQNQITALYNGGYPVGNTSVTFSQASNASMTGALTMFSGAWNAGSSSNSVTGATRIRGGKYELGSNATGQSFVGGLQVDRYGTLSGTSSNGRAIVGCGTTLIVNGTLVTSAAATYPSIECAAGTGTTYTFNVGNASGETPVLNVNGLRVKNTDASGMNVNQNTGATTTFTEFDNVQFSNSATTASAPQLQIYATSLSTTFNKCTFDNATNQYNVKLTGNGGTTTLTMAGATCSNAAPCVKYKKDDDNDYNGLGNGVGDTVGNMAVIRWVRAAPTDTAGSIQGFPTAAFDWNSYTYYSTYVAYNNANGSLDRIYVRSHTGDAEYYWEIPTGNGNVLGTPRWTTTSGTHYLYVLTTTGKLFRLKDDTSGLSLSTTGAGWSTNPVDTGSTPTTPLALDGTNLYFGGTVSSSPKLLTRAQSDGSAVGSALSVTNTVSAAAPAIGSFGTPNYLFLGQSGHFMKIDITNQQLTTDNNSATGNVNGRLTVLNGVVYGADDGGTFRAIDGTNFATTSWSFHDNANHSGCTGSPCSITASPYVDPTTSRGYFGDQDGHFYAVYNNGGTGTAVAGFSNFRPGASSEVFNSAALVQSGVIVVGTNSGNIYVIDQDAGSSAPSVYQVYKFSNAAVSSISNDPGDATHAGAYWQVGTSDGKLFYLDPLTDPTPGTP